MKSAAVLFSIVIAIGSNAVACDVSQSTTDVEATVSAHLKSIGVQTFEITKPTFVTIPGSKYPGLQFFFTYEIEKQKFLGDVIASEPPLPVVGNHCDLVLYPAQKTRTILIN